MLFSLNNIGQIYHDSQSNRAVSNVMKIPIRKFKPTHNVWRCKF